MQEALRREEAGGRRDGSAARISSTRWRWPDVPHRRLLADRAGLVPAAALLRRARAAAARRASSRTPATGTTARRSSPRLNRILVLKELGIEPGADARISTSIVGAAELRAMLLVRRNDAERALAGGGARLRQIETRIAQVERRRRALARRRRRARRAGAPAASLCGARWLPSPRRGA